MGWPACQFASDFYLFIQYCHTILSYNMSYNIVIQNVIQYCHYKIVYCFALPYLSIMIITPWISFRVYLPKGTCCPKMLGNFIVLMTVSIFASMLCYTIYVVNKYIYLSIITGYRIGTLNWWLTGLYATFKWLIK